MGGWFAIALIIGGAYLVAGTVAAGAVAIIIGVFVLVMVFGSDVL
jgi:hypothetical protein